MFIREVLTLVTISHPAVLKLTGFTIPTKDDKSFYLFTEFMPNGTLKDVKEIEQNGIETPFTPTKKTICAIGVAAGMKLIHHQKIIHRDLKPENIFFDENFYPKIADFNLARFDASQNLTGNLGTPYFMAPEMFGDDEKKIGRAIDVYAFAIVLLSIFDAKYKFIGKPPRSIPQLASYIISGKRFIIPGNCPKAYEKLINDCWQNDVNQRPTFEQIHKRITKEHLNSFILKGADEKEIHAYIKYLNKWENEVYNDIEIEEEEEEEEEEETREFDFDTK